MITRELVNPSCSRSEWATSDTPGSPSHTCGGGGAGRVSFTRASQPSALTGRGGSNRRMGGVVLGSQKQWVFTTLVTLDLTIFHFVLNLHAVLSASLKSQVRLLLEFNGLIFTSFPPLWAIFFSLSCGSLFSCIYPLPAVFFSLFTSFFLFVCGQRLLLIIQGVF